MTITTTQPFWIEGFRIDPLGLSIEGPAGRQAVEPKVMDVLCLMARRPGDTVTRDTFLDDVWGVKFGSDESLTRAISILRKRLGDQHGRRTIIETVPRKGYKLVGAVSQDGPIAYGPDDTIGMATEPHVTKKGRPVWPWLAALGAVSALMLLVFWMPRDGAQAGAVSDDVQINLVQIDAFGYSADLAPNPNRVERFESGFLELLSDAGIATRIGASRAGPSAELALSGNLSTDAEDRLVAQFNLEHVESGLTLWAETLTQPASAGSTDDVKFAAYVARILSCFKSWRNPEYRSQPETLQLYIRYCDAQNSPMVRDLTVFSKPIYEAEPDNPHAMSLHARALRSWSFRQRNSQIEDVMGVRRKALKLASKARQSDAEGRLVAAVWGVIHQDDADPQSIEAALAKAVQTPGLPTEIYQNYSDILRRLGRNEDALRVVQNIVNIDPYNPQILTRAGWLSAVEGDDINAEYFFNRAEAIDPENAFLQSRRRQVRLYLGDAASIETALDNWPVVITDNSSANQECLRGFVDARMSADPDIDALFVRCRSNDAPWKARMATMLGDVDKAYAAISDFDWSLFPGQGILLFYPEMAPFRADPRFEALAEELGLVEYWTRSRRLPDFCEDPDTPDICDTVRIASRKID